MNKLFDYDSNTDTKFRHPDMGVLKEQIDGLTLHGFEILFNYIGYLHRLGYKTNWYTYGNNIFLGSNLLAKRVALPLISEEIYKLMDVAFLDKPHIRFDEFQITFQYLTRIEDYCDILDMSPAGDINVASLLEDWGFLLFVVVCIVLKISDFNNLRANIDKLKMGVEDSES